LGHPIKIRASPSNVLTKESEEYYAQGNGYRKQDLTPNRILL